MAIFLGGTGLAGNRMSPFWILLELRMIAVVVATGAINKCAKLQSHHYHQQTNIQLLYRRMPFLSPNQQCQSTEGNSYLTYTVDKMLWHCTYFCIFSMFVFCIFLFVYNPAFWLPYINKVMLYLLCSNKLSNNGSAWRNTFHHKQLPVCGLECSCLKAESCIGLTVDCNDSHT